MIKVIDMAGKQIGDWTVLRKDEARSEKYAYWICRCKCGKERSVNGSSLRSGGSKGCGCARAEKLRQLMKQTAWASSPENAQRAKRGLCYNVFCPRRDNYKGAWSCRYCHGCAGRETKRVSKREIFDMAKIMELFAATLDDYVADYDKEQWDVFFRGEEYPPSVRLEQATPLFDMTPDGPKETRPACIQIIGRPDVQVATTGELQISKKGLNRMVNRATEVLNLYLHGFMQERKEMEAAQE